MFVRRDQTNQIVNLAKREITHANKYLPPHLLSEGDVVYYENDPAPFEVVRIGYDYLLQQVRVRRLDEPHAHTAGRWMCYDKLYVLEIDDELITMNDIEDSSEARNIIQRNTRCRFAGYDQDGDVFLDTLIAGRPDKRYTIWFADLRYISLC